MHKTILKKTRNTNHSAMIGRPDSRASGMFFRGAESPLFLPLPLCQNDQQGSVLIARMDSNRAREAVGEGRGDSSHDRDGAGKGFLRSGEVQCSEISLYSWVA